MEDWRCARGTQEQRLLTRFPCSCAVSSARSIPPRRTLSRLGDPRTCPQNLSPDRARLASLRAWGRGSLCRPVRGNALRGSGLRVLVQRRQRVLRERTELRPLRPLQRARLPAVSVRVAAHLVEPSRQARLLQRCSLGRGRVATRVSAASSSTTRRSRTPKCAKPARIAITRRAVPAVVLKTRTRASDSSGTRSWGRRARECHRGLTSKVCAARPTCPRASYRSVVVSPWPTGPKVTLVSNPIQAPSGWRKR